MWAFPRSTRRLGHTSRQRPGGQGGLLLARTPRHRAAASRGGGPLSASGLACLMPRTLMLQRSCSGTVTSQTLGSGDDHTPKVTRKIRTGARKVVNRMIPSPPIATSASWGGYAVTGLEESDPERKQSLLWAWRKQSTLHPTLLAKRYQTGPLLRSRHKTIEHSGHPVDSGITVYHELTGIHPEMYVGSKAVCKLQWKAPNAQKRVPGGLKGRIEGPGWHGLGCPQSQQTGTVPRVYLHLKPLRSTEETLYNECINSLVNSLLQGRLAFPPPKGGSLVAVSL